MINTANTKFFTANTSVEVWFTDQFIKALKTEDNVNLTIIIGWIL